MATNVPVFPSMILRPRMTKQSASVMLAKALSFASSRRDTRTSVMSIFIVTLLAGASGRKLVREPLPVFDGLSRWFRDGGKQPSLRETSGNFNGAIFVCKDRVNRRSAPRHGRKTRLFGEQLFQQTRDRRKCRNDRSFQRIPKGQCAPRKPCQDGISSPQVKSGSMGCQPKSRLCIGPRCGDAYFRLNNHKDALLERFHRGQKFPSPPPQHGPAVQKKRNIAAQRRADASELLGSHIQAQTA